MPGKSGKASQERFPTQTQEEEQNFRVQGKKWHKQKKRYEPDYNGQIKMTKRQGVFRN